MTTHFYPEKLPRLTALLLTGILACSLALSGCKKQANPDQLARAQKLIDQGNYDKALMELNQALAQAPNDPGVHQDLGWLYLFTGDIGKTRRELSQLEQLAPDAAETYHLRGALFHFVAQQAADPKDAHDAGEAAVTNLQAALEKDPNNDRTYLDLAGVLADMNRNESALDVLSKGFARIPDSDREMQANFEIASCSAHAELQMYEKAIAECKQALSITQNPESRQQIDDLIQNMQLMNPKDTGNVDGKAIPSGITQDTEIDTQATD
jgi:tetratricopeptide (TPR) repeat protein